MLFVSNGIYIVPVEGSCDDWAAYQSNEYTKRDGNTEDIIKSSGTKIAQSLAEELFPEYAEKYTWRR